MDGEKASLSVFLEPHFEGVFGELGSALEEVTGDHFALQGPWETLEDARKGLASGVDPALEVALYS